MNSQRVILTYRHFLVFILVSYAVVFSPFVDAGLRNYLVLLAGAVGGVLFLSLRLPMNRQSLWALLLFYIMTLQSLYLDGPRLLGSVGLTFLYAMGYFATASLLNRIADKRSFLMKVMRGIIFAFAILSVIQMLASLAGLPMPNEMATKGMWSYNSLAFEPSQLGRVVGISMLCYLVLSNLPGESEPPRERLKLVIAFVITMLLSGSALAAAAILLVYVLSRSLPWVILAVTVSSLIWPVFLGIDYEPIQRFILLASNIGSLDLDQVLAAEHSGGIRVAPFLIYLRDASVEEVGYWLGYGAEGLTYFFQGKIPGMRDDVVGAGFLPGFAVVYGGLVFAFFVWVFVLRQANQITLPLIAFWAIFMTSSGWNTQVFWYGLIVIQVAWAVSRDRFNCPQV